MHRWYRAELYAERIGVIRRLLPDAAIGADVIAGFPGETEQDFLETVAFIERQPLTYLHVFSFSPRPGTKADHLGQLVPPAEIRERARYLRSLSARRSAAFRAAQAGRVLSALTLHRQGDGWTEALTRNYLKVRIAGLLPANEWRKIVLAAADGEVCSEASGLIFENDLGQSDIATVRDRESDVFHAQAIREFPGNAREV